MTSKTSCRKETQQTAVGNGRHNSNCKCCHMHRENFLGCSDGKYKANENNYKARGPP